MLPFSMRPLQGAVAPHDNESWLAAAAAAASFASFFSLWVGRSFVLLRCLPG